jgi:shikimate kinase
VTASSRTPLIVLVGYRGSGKTTVAPLVAERLGWQWIDADRALESRCGRPIEQMFQSEGEAAFRDREADLLAELCGRDRHVVAAGGGVVMRPGNRECLTQAGLVVWLRADVDTLWRRLQGDALNRRPDLTVGGRAEVEQLLALREPLYRACANVVVDTVGRSPEEVANEILARWRVVP